MDDDNAGSGTTTVPRIKLNLSPPTPEEIERRRALVERMRQRREKIGPIGVRIEDIIHDLRGGDERFDKEPPASGR
jgi:hypothetical protein